MRNLKKLLAVIVAVCTIMAFTVPAFAAETAPISADAQICKDLGVLVGDTQAGVTDTYLAKGTTRIQAATLYLRLIGKEQTAYASTPATNFADADKAGYANGTKLLGYLKENPDLGWQGVSADKFDPKGAASAQMIYKVALEALGYKAGTDFQWADTITFAAGKGLSQIADVTKLTNDDTATALVEALKATVKGGTDTLAAKLVAAGTIDRAAAVAAGLVADKVTATVAATGAKKLTVTFNQAVDTTKAVIAVARGTVKPSVKSVTFADDKKSAVIEFTTAMAEGDYTVTVTGLGDAATATVKVAAEKLTTIKFLSEVAVISVNNVTTNVKAENQYGEDVTSKLASANVTPSKGTSASCSNKGVITVVGTPSLFNVDDKVVVTIVDATTGVVATKTLTVAKAASVATIEFGALTTDDKDLKDKEINVTAMTTNADKYYMPITVKDQYGNTLDAAAILTAVNFYSSNGNIVTLGSPKVVDLADDKGTAVKFAAATPSPTNGTAVITAVSVSTGVTANTTIVVKENAKLDVVTLAAPAAELKLTKPEVLPVTAVDTYGKDVALKDVTFAGAGTSTLTLNTNTTISAVNATFSISKDYVKDVTSIKITPTAKNIVVTVTTATGKYQSITLTANDAPVVSGIKGAKSDFVSMLANDTSLYTDLGDNLQFVDQYGDDIDAPTFDAADSTSALDYTIAKDGTSSVTTLTGDQIYATTTAGSVNYVVTLKDASNTVLDTYTVGVTVVDKDKITAFSIDDLNKFYTETDAAATHQQTIKVHGLVDGKKVVVNQNMIQSVTANNGLLGINSTSHVFTPTDVNTDSKDTNATITVLVANTDNTYIVTKDVVYSNAAPKATSIEAQYDEKKVEGGAIQVAVAELNKDIVPDSNNSLLQFVAKDQYGVQRVYTAFAVVVTNRATTGNFDATGTGSGFIAGDAGKALTVTVIIDGLYQTLKIIAE